jgi:hypothetical protein
MGGQQCYSIELLAASGMHFHGRQDVLEARLRGGAGWAATLIGSDRLYDKRYVASKHKTILFMSILQVGTTLYEPWICLC